MLPKNNIILLVLYICVGTIYGYTEDISHTTFQTVKASDFSIVTFNVQNLFDGVNDKQEYSSYKPPKWTKKNYEKRLVAIGKALQNMPRPTLIALQEVEHEQVVTDLQEYYLSAFEYVAITDNPFSATENALISQYEIESVNTHTIQDSFYRNNRYILDVIVKVPLEHGNITQLQVIVVHLKSKIPSKSKKYSSDQIRAMQYELIQRIENPAIPSIIIGDFNDTVPIESLQTDGANTESKYISYPFTSHYNEVEGTYYYKHEWQQLDHILVDKESDMLFQDELITVLDYAPFLTEDGVPNKFILYKENYDAVSDHLPLLFVANFTNN